MSPEKDQLETIGHLEARYAEIYRSLAPTIKEYTRMAAEALELQTKIYKHHLQRAFPSATLSDKPRALTFSARESPDSFRQMLATLQEKKLNVTDIVFDPARHEFQIYAVS
jgi:hypothetical protein